MAHWDSAQNRAIVNALVTRAFPSTQSQNVYCEKSLVSNYAVRSTELVTIGVHVYCLDSIIKKNAKYFLVPAPQTLFFLTLKILISVCLWLFWSPHHSFSQCPYMIQACVCIQLHEYISVPSTLIKMGPVSSQKWTQHISDTSNTMQTLCDSVCSIEFLFIYIPH